MKKTAKPILVLASGALFIALITQPTTAQGQLNISGTSILSPSFLPTGVLGSGYTAYPEEYPTVLWKVVENSGVYTYTYTVNDPTGDVQLNIPSGTLTSNPETVDSFQLSFDTTSSGYVAGSQAGGAGTTTLNNDQTGGLFWGFNPISPSSSSPTLSFLSTLPPVFGYAEASDSVSPSPWVSNPGETPNALLPMPAPEPSTMALLVGALVFMPLRSFLKRRAS